MIHNFFDKKTSNITGEQELVLKTKNQRKNSTYQILVYLKNEKYTPLKDKKYITITNASQKFLKCVRHKSNKIWIDKGSKFYKRLMKSWLQGNDIEMYSTHNEKTLLLLKDLLDL